MPKQVQVQWAPDGSEDDTTPIESNPYMHTSPGYNNPYSTINVPTLPQVTATPSQSTAPAPLISAYNQAVPGEAERVGHGAQLSALQRLQGYASGQPTALDDAQQSAYNAQQTQYARAMGDAQQASRAERGYNNPLLASLGQQVQAQQRGVAANQQALDMNAYSQQRALQAMGAAGQLATGMRSQRWEEDYKRARARDIIRNANVNANNTVAQGNVTRANQVGQYNAGLPWQIAGVAEQRSAGAADTMRGNTTDAINKIQQQKDNEKALASGAVNITTGLMRGGV